MADTDHDSPGPDDVQALGRKWLELGQAFLAGLAESSARRTDPHAAGAQRDPASSSAGLFQIGSGLLEAWRSAWTGVTAAQTSSAQAFADWMASMPQLGPAREHTRLLSELAEAQAECRRLEQELAAVLTKVHSEALDLLTQRLNATGASASTAAGYREVYDLWVECGEQVYAQVAHSEAYCRLQGALGNATMRLRAKQQALIEQGLKQLDLPTRSELNSLHRQVRELRQKVASLEVPKTGRKRSTKRSMS